MIGPLRLLLSPYFREHGDRLMLFIYEIPQALGLAIPIGCMLGILYGMRDRPASRRSTAAILAFAGVASLVAFATLGWMIPPGSRAYHAAFSIPQATRGLNEFTLGELSRQIDSYVGTPMAKSGLVRDLTFTYQQKWALSAATVVLALFAVSMARWLSAGWLKPFLLAGAGLSVTTCSCSSAERPRYRAPCQYSQGRGYRMSSFFSCLLGC